MGDHTNSGPTANDLKPSGCASLNLTSVLTGSGVVTGTAGNQLILGSSGADTLTGAGGSDCIVGGAGLDTLSGGPGGNNICIGNSQTVFLITCQTQIRQ